MRADTYKRGDDECCWTAAIAAFTAFLALLAASLRSSSSSSLLLDGGTSWGQRVLRAFLPSNKRDDERLMPTGRIEIQDEINGLHRALESYADQHAIPPPPGLKRKVMKRVDSLATIEKEESIQPTYIQSIFSNITLAASILFPFRRIAGKASRIRPPCGKRMG